MIAITNVVMGVVLFTIGYYIGVWRASKAFIKLMDENDNRPNAFQRYEAFCRRSSAK